MAVTSNDADQVTRGADDEDAAMRLGFESAGDDNEPTPEAGSKPAGDEQPAAQPTGSAEPEKVEQPAAPEPKATPDDGKPGESTDPPPDPFASLPQEVRSLLAKVPALEAQLAESDRRNRSLDGQVRSLQSRLDRADSQRAQQPKADNANEPAKGQARLPKLEKVRETLGADLPEVLDALDEMASLLAPEPSQASQPQPERADPAAAQPDKKPEQAPSGGMDPVVAAHLSTVDNLRPGWWQELESDDARLWFATNRDVFQQYSAADTAPKLIAVIDAYRSHVQRVQQARDSAASRAAKVAAGVQPQGARRAPTRAAPMTEEEAMSLGFNS